MLDDLCKITRIRTLIENVYFNPETNLIYDYRTSTDQRAFDHLPTPEEINRRLPNPCGWGSGMEDSVLTGAVALDMYIDLHDHSMTSKIFNGLISCAEVSGIPGFIARSISPRDKQSFYPESSRDQYTNFTYGLWRYFHSGLASQSEKETMIKHLEAVASFCEKHVVPEEDWTLPRADFRPPKSTVCKMWNVNAHEAARLPMIYAAAWDVTRKKHWLESYRKFTAEAAEASLNLQCQSYHSYSLLQMIYSCLLIEAIEPDPALKRKYRRAIKQADDYITFNLLRAADLSYRADYSALPMDWRNCRQALIIPGCLHVIPCQPDNYKNASKVIRETGEAILIRLLQPGPRLSALDRKIFRWILDGYTPDCVGKSDGIYLAAAWYKAAEKKIHL